ncbi:MAG TPA: alpha/beta hydrolase [Nocardioidaceae bacterium]|nr:alpha/beta hydrolase [Nocardioidaceae bacterium]
MPDYQLVRTPDGRDLEVLQSGVPDGRTVVYHSGTPTGSVPFPSLDDAAAERGLRVVTYCRPGYGNSTSRPGRTVADAAADTATILDQLGVDAFLTIGWSGGGPHALACAAMLPGRCGAAASIAGVAPYGVDGLDWTDGMGPENVEEFAATAAGIDELTAHLAKENLAGVTAESVAASFGELVSEVDRAALTGPTAEYIAGGFGRAVLHGTDGWRDDDLAFMADWGFDVALITTPLSIWQGAHDQMVPYAHGQWLAEHVPAARVHLLPDDGHISLSLRLGEILDELVSIASPRS